MAGGVDARPTIDSFFTYIANNDQLVRQQGGIFDRNEGRAPWVNQLDLSIAQEIPGFSEGHKGEIRLDIFNFLNLLNKDWGVEHRASFPLERTLANVRASTTRAVTSTTSARTWMPTATTRRPRCRSTRASRRRSVGPPT